MPPSKSDLLAQGVSLDIQRMDSKALAALVPAMAHAQAEISKELSAWLTKLGPNAATEKFTVAQLQQAQHLLGIAQTQAANPKFTYANTLAKAAQQAMGGGHAPQQAVQTLMGNLDAIRAKFSDMPAMQLKHAAFLAKGDKLVLDKYATSAKRYAGQVKDDLKLQFGIGLAKGETVNKLVTRISKLSGFRQAVDASHPPAAGAAMGAALTKRYHNWANRLVLTELNNAYNNAAYQGIRAAHAIDDRIVMVWDAANDMRVCPECRSLHNKEVSPKTNGGYFKGTLLHPPAHPYCRCTVVAWHADWAEGAAEPPMPPSVEELAAEEAAKKAAALAAKKAAEQAALAAKHAAEAAALKTQQAAERKAAEEAIATQRAQEIARQAAAAEAAKVAAAQDLAAYDEHKVMQAALKAKMEAEAAAALKAAEELAAKLAAELAAAKAAAEKLAAEEALYQQQLAEQKAAAALAQAKAADEAKAAADAAAKATADAKKGAAKAKKLGKLLEAAPKFDPESSPTINLGYYGAKKKGKGSELLASKGLHKIDADTYVGHGYKFEWKGTDMGGWVKVESPAKLGYVPGGAGSSPWVKSGVVPQAVATPTTATPAPPPAPAPAPKLAPHIVESTSQPANILGYEWKQTNPGQWVLHKDGVPSHTLVKAPEMGVTDLQASYQLGGDLAKKGLVATAPGRMEGYGYTYVKSASDGKFHMVSSPAHSTIKVPVDMPTKADLASQLIKHGLVKDGDTIEGFGYTYAKTVQGPYVQTHTPAGPTGVKYTPANTSSHVAGSGYSAPIEPPKPKWMPTRIELDPNRRGVVDYSKPTSKAYSGFHGKAHAQDGDAIEGHSVRVLKVMGSDGQEYYETTFKVTHPYGDAARAYGTGAGNWSFRGRTEKKGVMHDNGKDHSLGFGFATRVRQEGTTTVEIGANGAINNQVRIRAKSLADLNAGMDDLSKHLGKDLRQTTEREDLELQTKARLAAKYSPHAFGSAMRDAVSPEAQREVIEKQWASAAAAHPQLHKMLADAEEVEVYPGLKTLYSKSLGKELGAKWGSMYHDGSPPAKIAADIISDTGLMSSNKRYQSGVFTTGMSTSTDFETGGADGVFMRVHKQADPGGTGSGFRIVLDTEKVMGRLDWWAFDHDNYGRSSYDQYKSRWAVPSMGHASSGNEVMAPHGVPPSAMKHMICAQSSYRNEVLEELRKRKVTHINGTPIEEFVRLR